MLLGILTLITALSISAVAIYYSVAGLVAIFAAAAVPIMIMGGVLEVSKLVTAVWLHRYWKQATWWLKTYLSTAVIVLMLITSMGIFGFLSKAHIEQTAQSTDNLARVETIQNEIDRNLGIVGRAENRIRQLETSGTGSDTNIQNQIDREQERIDKAFERIQPAIDEQNAIIAGVTKLFQDELDKIDADLETLQGYIDNGETKKAQQMIGASADGIFGKNTAEKIGDWKEEKEAERAEWLTKIQEAANSPTVKAARDEIARLRKSAEDQVANSQALIERLRTQLANSDNADEIQKSIDEQNERVRSASSEIDQLTEEKIQLESEYRKLEAEVGPIKYIAEFIYGETADNNMLEEAVRWVIITIIFVFDPLAVLLLIASNS
jgi:DNA repair exonuclease SbcCD ATPase subunit